MFLNILIVGIIGGISILLVANTIFLFLMNLSSGPIKDPKARRRRDGLFIKCVLLVVVTIAFTVYLGGFLKEPFDYMISATFAFGATGAFMHPSLKLFNWLVARGNYLTRSS